LAELSFGARAIDRAPSMEDVYGGDADVLCLLVYRQVTQQLKV